MTEDKRYTAEQLASLAGVTLRTVRYYIQEELIDRPLARGPGAHFTDGHLRQLRRCKLLQDWGFDLETIRDKSGSLQSILASFPIPDDPIRTGALLRSLSDDMPSEFTPRQTAKLKAAVQALRGKPQKLETKSATEVIPMAEGIDLIIDKTRYAMPSPKELVDIALLIRKTFDANKKPDEDD